MEAVALTYAIVGAPTAYWDDSEVGCLALYRDGAWESRELFRRYADDWRNLLAGGSARPVRVPATIETRLIATEPLHTVPRWELRALAIDVSGDDWLEFDGDWPAHDDT